MVDESIQAVPSASSNAMHDPCGGPGSKVDEKTATEDSMTWSDRWQAIRPSFLPMIQSFMIQFITGINDSNLGIMLPSIKAHYGLSQYVVSIIFLCNSLGYVASAFANGYLVKHISQARTALLGSCSMVIGFLVVLFGVPFPVMCIFIVFVGLGVGLTQASSNVVCGELPYNTVMLSFLHANYAAGGLIGPLMASGLLQAGKTWNTSYIILTALAIFNTLSICVTFRRLRIQAEREADAEKELALQKERDLENLPPAVVPTPISERNSMSPTIYSDSESDRSTVHSTKKPQQSMLQETLLQRIVYMGAPFLLFYTGVEVTIGNWGYTFLITARSTDLPKMAHFMSGYWGGLCAGRLFLGYFTLRFGEKRMVYLYLSVIVVMLTLLWVLPYIGANATSLVITGFALGPLFPTTVSVAHKLIPTRLYACSVGFLSACASTGSALMPYITGVLIGSTGVQAMLPFVVAMSSAMLVAWAAIPDPVDNGSLFTVAKRLFRRVIWQQRQEEENSCEGKPSAYTIA